MISITDEIAYILDIWGMKTCTLIRSALSKFAPPPRLSVSDWADGFRQLSAEGSAEPGRWRTDRAPYQREIMNAIAEPGVHTVVLMCSAQVGKALDINTPLPTPNGWVLMRDVQVGDRLFDENGQIANVTFVTPVMYDRPCWRLTFSDGSDIIADSDHQWTLEARQDGQYKETVSRTTSAIESDYRQSMVTYFPPHTAPILEDKINLPVADYIKERSHIVSKSPRRSIVTLWRVESVPVRCIQVDSPSHLYLAGKQMIPTHNTEIGNNILGYHLDLDPCPILFLQPTLEMAESYSKERLAPMIRDTPRLRDKLGEGRSRDSNSTLLHKNFAGGHLSMAGANSPASLASRPIRLLLCDEVDRYPASAGAEGDPVDLARKRTTTFWNRKVVLFSTPTIKGASRIEKAYNESDQRKYLVACPHCGFRMPLTWERLLYPGKDTDSPDPQGVYYGCISCDRPITPSLKKQILAQGQWVKSKITHGLAGFHLNELYSPWKSWADVAADYEKARKDAQQLRVWWNTSLGLPWEIQAGEKLQWEQLFERAADSTYSCGEVPVDNCILTAGVDVQGDRLECSVWAWGEGEQSWLVAHEQIFGDPLQEDVWGQLQSITTRKYADKKITATCIDTGFSTQDVYGQIRKRKHLRWYAVKGKSGEGRAVVGRPRYQEVNYRGRTIKNGVQLYVLGVDAAKEALYARSKITTPGPKYMNFPNDVDTGWLQGFCSEVQVIKHRAGQPYYQWEKLPKVRNEPLDCAVYAYAAAILAGVTRIDWSSNNVKATKSRVETTQTKKKSKNKSTNWINSY